MPLRLAPLVAAVLLAPASGATDIEVVHVEAVRSDAIRGDDRGRPAGYNVTLRWNDAWRTDRNYDAAWVFLKHDRPPGAASAHAYLVPGTGRMLRKGSAAMPDATVEVAEDGTGLFVYASGPYRGPLEYTVAVAQDTARTDLRLDRLRGHAIEMVYVPAGPYWLGAADPLAVAYNAFYRSDGDGAFGGPFRVESADQAIPVGPEPGSLYYRSDEPAYQGDQQGPIPAAFPNGAGAFYLMKYEVSQGEYAAFLNGIGDGAASVRAGIGAPNYRRYGGTIVLEDGVFRAEAPRRRNVYWHWDDMMAYADWAGLRPYTELEFAKAARGPDPPVPLGYPWGTASTDRMLRRVDVDTQSIGDVGGLDEGALSDATRERFGASPYWVMDLAGSMWEKVVTPGDPTGRAFTGSHGDGAVTYEGEADVAGWPAGVTEGAGYGYRGGGYYGRNATLSDFNPFSPVAFRRYGAWSGGARNAAYGFRAARTAP